MWAAGLVSFSREVFSRLTHYAQDSVLNTGCPLPLPGGPEPGETWTSTASLTSWGSL